MAQLVGRLRILEDEAAKAAGAELLPPPTAHKQARPPKKKRLANARAGVPKVGEIAGNSESGDIAVTGLMLPCIFPAASMAHNGHSVKMNRASPVMSKTADEPADAVETVEAEPACHTSSSANRL